MSFRGKSKKQDGKIKLPGKLLSPYKSKTNKNNSIFKQFFLNVILIKFINIENSMDFSIFQCCATIIIIQS